MKTGQLESLQNYHWLWERFKDDPEADESVICPCCQIREQEDPEDAACKECLEFLYGK